MIDLAECNEFDKFATFTFDPKKHPLCKDYEYAKKIIIKWLKNQQLTHGSFRYILVPERQSSGNIHFHALLGGFTGKYYKTNIRNKGRKDERQCYKIKSWETRYGFADMEDISYKQRAANYIAKYINKDMTRTHTPESEGMDKHTQIIQKNGKRYFSSKGLNKPTRKYNEHLDHVISENNLDMETKDEFENDFAIITTYRKSKD
jgi:hypothetical protein